MRMEMPRSLRKRVRSHEIPANRGGRNGEMGGDGLPFRPQMRYHTSMKSNTKSSVTLPPEELRLVIDLQRRLRAKSKVEVVRRGLRLLRDVTDREALRGADREATRARRAA